MPVTNSGKFCVGVGWRMWWSPRHLYIFLLKSSNMGVFCNYWDVFWSWWQLNGPEGLHDIVMISMMGLFWPSCFMISMIGLF
jgi:hypothetical protein